MGNAFRLLEKFNEYELIIIRDGIAYCNGCSGQYSLLAMLIEESHLSMQVCNKANEDNFMIIKGESYAK